MKIRYAIAMAGLLAVPAAWAADMPMQGGPMMMQDDPTEQPKVQQDLKLTDDQKKQLQAIHDDAKAKREALRKETQDKVSKVLTPEQNKKLDEIRAQRKEHREERMEHRKERMQQRQEHMDGQKQ